MSVFVKFLKKAIVLIKMCPETKALQKAVALIESEIKKME